MTECAHIFEDRGREIKICRKCSYIHDSTKVFKNNAPQDTSDGYHTFEELYEHRMALFSVICNTYKDKAWKSKLHSDNTMYENFFIVGITTDEGNYTYHYRLEFWDRFQIKELKNAPEWDGHNPNDYTRLFTLVEEKPLSERVNSGDLVIPKGKHEADIYIVEAADKDSVLLVNGKQDLFFSQDTRNLDEFNKGFHLLVEEKYLNKE